MTNFGFTEPDEILVKVEELPRLIRTMRKVKGVTQRQLSDSSQVRRPTVAQVELGRQAIPLDVLERLAKGLGYQLEIKLVREKQP